MLGISIWEEGLELLAERSVSAIDAWRAARGQPFVFACANPHSLVVSERDPEFKSALQGASAVVADGVGLTMIARSLYGGRMISRITGSDYFSTVMRALNGRAGRTAFFGSRPEVLQRIVARCAVDFPRVIVAAAISPPYGAWSEEANARFLEEIRQADVDALWVGMTAPKQEKWVQANRQHLRAGVIGSVGAVFDYYAGTVKRAPSWVCRAGLEWAYRFVREPARLWERNFVSTPRFMGLAARDAMSGGRAAARRGARS
jgi:N-acetylglucosaminyldiphosphoundecaprenol N-acetyl-beta-D-mannosaminyltransferase